MRRGRLLAVGALAASVAVAALLLSGGGGGRPAGAPAQFGANVNYVVDGHALSAAQTNAQLAALRRAGATLARSDAFWEAAEPRPPVQGVHRYDWAFADSVAGALAAHGLRWLPIIDYSPPWAQSVPGSDHSAPASPGDYAAYAAALAGRYGPGGSFWSTHPGLPKLPVETYEIWNEPDNPVFWVPRPDPAAYAALYLRARNAIHVVQPGARVIVGGLTHPGRFAAALIAASPALRHSLDGLAVHPYGATPQAVLANLRTARQAMDATGLGAVPIYVTEFGWTTSPPGAEDYLLAQLRPGYLEQTLAALGHLDCGVAAALVYTWVTPRHNPNNGQDWFGIADPDGRGPDAAAFARGLQAARPPGATDRVCGD